MSNVFPVITNGIQLSPQQQAVIDWVRDGSGSVNVEAVAGSGKSFTLTRAVEHMTGTVAMLAFNKSVADHLKAKLQHLGNVRIGTFHSFGFGAWRRVYPEVRVDAQGKWREMMSQCNVPDKMRQGVGRLVSLAKQSVIELEWNTNNTGSWNHLIDHYDILTRVEDDGRSDNAVRSQLIHLASWCVDWARVNGDRVVDFDDMIWLPLLEGCSFYRNDWVLIDEVQDTNAGRRLMAEKMLVEGGRVLAVGDRRQAIYGFAGADSSAVDQVVRSFGCQEMPLTVTYRCSKAATEMAREWVPEITAAEENLDGVVSRASAVQFWNTYGSGFKPGYPAGNELQGDINRRLRPGDAILCRLTKPLVSLALRLIREGIGCHVEGRDIGKSITRLITRWPGVRTISDLVHKLHEYQLAETKNLVARDAGPQIEALKDRIDTVYAIMEGCETIRDIERKIGRLFKDTRDGITANTVTLSTVHKFKGREANRVFILGWNEYMPSKWAKKEWEREQEENLRYVAVTRTLGDLILVAALEDH